MIVKRIKKINKLVFLIAVRQIWKLLCNLYNIIEQPFLALKTLIVKDKDKSQMFLVGIFFLMPILTYLAARIVWDYHRYGLVLNGVGMVFLMAIIIQILFLLYLGYWVWRVIRKKY
jgi:hypothetical protein